MLEQERIQSGSAFIQIEVSGAAITNFSLLHPGSGNLFSIGGGETVRSRSYVGSGTLFNFVSSEEKIATDYIGGGGIKFSGDTRVSFAPNWFGEGTVKVDGTPTKLLRTFTQNEVGNLFTMSGDGYHERRTYDYNDSSIVFFDYENFGFIPSTASIQSITSSQILSGVSTDPVVRIENGVTAVVDPQFQCIINANTVPTRLFDHGTITEGYSGNIDYGFINQTVTNYPFGKFLLVSDTVTNFSLGHFTSGGITLDGTARARVNPQWFAEIQIEVNGGEQYSLTKTHVGIGTLFNFVSTTDRRAFAYEGEGQIFAISGAAESVTFNKDEQQMLFSIGGVSTNSFTPNWNGTARAEIFGTAEPVLRTFGYQTEGTLFAISGLVERRTYHYNLSSINYHQYRDYAGLPASGSITTITTSQDLSGSAPTSIIQIGVPGAGVVGTIPDGDTFTIDPTIGSIVNTFIDCGLITSPNNERTVREDYGFTSVPSSIRTKVTEYPFGHIARFVSSTTTPFSIANYVGGEFRIFGEGLDKVTPKHTSEGTLFALSGAAEVVGFKPTRHHNRSQVCWCGSRKSYFFRRVSWWCHQYYWSGTGSSSNSSFQTGPIQDYWYRRRILYSTHYWIRKSLHYWSECRSDYDRYPCIPGRSGIQGCCNNQIYDCRILHHKYQSWWSSLPQLQSCTLWCRSHRHERRQYSSYHPLSSGRRSNLCTQWRSRICNIQSRREDCTLSFRGAGHSACNIRRKWTCKSGTFWFYSTRNSYILRTTIRNDISIWCSGCRQCRCISGRGWLYLQSVKVPKQSQSESLHSRQISNSRVQVLKVV